MPDIPAYIMVQLHVTDAAEYRKYEKGFFPILKSTAESLSLTTINRTPSKALRLLKGAQFYSNFQASKRLRTGTLTLTTKRLANSDALAHA